MAEQSPGQLPGDVIVQLKMRKHQKFNRQGNDLHMTIKISLKEALLGFKRKISHLDGHAVELEVQQPSVAYQVFRIENEGMPHKDDPTLFGHLFVKVEVAMPKRLSSDQKALVEKLFPERLLHEEL